MNRNEYSAAEQKLLNHVKEIGDQISGWQKDQPKKIADIDSIVRFNKWCDPWSPIWTDEDYAKKSKWGSIVAYPFYIDRFDMIKYNINLEDEQITRGMLCNHYGGEFHFYKPVYAGDELRVYQNPPQFIETIKDDEEHEGPRAFGYVQRDCDLYNQRGEHVAKHRHLLDAVLYDRPRGERYALPEYQDHWYTDAQNQWILDIAAKEYRRGAEPRYWEDVKVGEELAHTTLGSMRLWDMISWYAVCDETPMYPTRVFREMGATFPDPYCNCQRFGLEWHFATDLSQKMSNPRAVLFADSCRTQLGRISTNWMGDDARMVYHRNLHFMQSPHGTCLVGCGRVSGKRIEDGKFLVDLETWLYDMCNGNVADAAHCTVEVPSNGTANPKVDYNEQLEVPELDSIPVGTRVRLHAPESLEWWPDDAYPLEGVEGTVFRKYFWRDALQEFTSYVDVKLDQSTCAKPFGIGNELTFRADQIEIL